jgi:DMSO/TMAO reductase YedYZ molybdopterin-dependent catalytic subunit
MSTTSRRHFLGLLGSTIVAPLAAQEAIYQHPIENGKRRLIKYPQKRPLIVATSRPPQLETPFEIYGESLYTPNDAFFVRYHLANVPLEIDSNQHQVSVTGAVKKPFTFTLAELKTQYEQVELNAVLQCSGNGRGFSSPRVGGGQLANGAMGFAKWKGVRLKDILAKAEIDATTAKRVTFNGLDAPVLPTTPDFVKAIDVDHAMDGEVIVAYEMNGEDLPLLNGFPLRLIVPGYFGTYWVKHLSEIKILSEPFTGFWNTTAYQIPDNGCGFIEVGTKFPKTKEITKYKVRSFITSHVNGATLPHQNKVALSGMAFDGGYGISEVQLSLDRGKTWMSTELGEDLGKYAFRPWSLSPIQLPKGKHELKVRAINRVGESQPLNAAWNPKGYMRNVVETTTLEMI